MTYVKSLMLFWMATLQLDCYKANVRLGRKKIEVIHKGKTLPDLVVFNSRPAPHDLDHVNDFIRPKLREESNAEGMMLQKNGIEDFRPLDLTIDTGKDPSDETQKPEEVEAGLFSNSNDGDENEDFTFLDMPEYNHETKADFKGNQEAIDWLMKDPNEYNVKSYEDSGSLRDVFDNFEHSHARHNVLQDDKDIDDVKEEPYLIHEHGDGKVRQGGQPRETEASHVRHSNHDYHGNHDNGVNFHAYHVNHGHFSGKAGKSRKKDFGLEDYEDYGATGRNTNDNLDQVEDMSDYNDGSSKKYETESYKSSSQNNVNRLLENQDAKLYKELSNFQNFEDYENFDNDDDDFDSFDNYNHANSFKDYENDEGELDYQDNVLHTDKKQSSEQPDADRGSHSEWKDDTETSDYDAQERDRQESDNRVFENGNVSDDEPDGDRGSTEDEEPSTETIEETNDNDGKQYTDDQDQENYIHGNDKSKQGNGSERVGSVIENEKLEDAAVVSHNSHAIESENNSALPKSYSAKDSLENKKHNDPIEGKEVVIPIKIGNQTVTRGRGNNHENRNTSQVVLGEKISNDSSVIGKNITNNYFHSLSEKVAGQAHISAHASDSSENKIAVADPKGLPINDLSNQKDVDKSNNAKLEVSLKTTPMFKSNEQGKEHHGVVEGKSDDIFIHKLDHKLMEPSTRANGRRMYSDLIKSSSQMETGESRKDSRRHHRRHNPLARIYSFADLNTMERIVSSLRGTGSPRTSPTKSSMQKKHGELSLKSLYYYPLHPTPQEDSDTPGVGDHMFSEWNAWSTCSVSCGTGARVRARVCLVSTCPQKDMYQTKTCLQPICQDELKEESLDAHNEIRTKHFSPPLAWSTSLAKKAQTIANQLAGKEFLSLDDLREAPGESIAQIKYTGGNVLKRAIRKWYNEVKSYSFSYPKINDRTRHFVQIVWKGTKEMGLAVARSSSGDYAFVVALYSPPTDTRNHVTLNVLRPGHKHDVYATFRKRNT